MASNYPGALDTFTDKTNDVDNVDAAHVNNLQDAVEAIQGELGTNPSGASATVAAAIALKGNKAGETWTGTHDFTGATVTGISGGGGSVADGSITTAKLADDAVTTGKIAAGAVGTTDIADGAVTSAKIADGTIATADLADGAVTAAKVAADVATQSELDAVSAAKANATHTHAASDIASGTLAIARGGTGGATAAAARSALAIRTEGVYVPAGWGQHWNAALSVAGTSTNKAIISVMGDSIAHGYYTSSLRTKAWTQLMRAELQALKGDGGIGFLGVVDNLQKFPAITGYSSTVDWQALTGSWNQTPVVAGPSGTTLSSNVDGSTITYQQVRGTTISVYWVGAATTGTFSWTIDGVSQGTVNTVGSNRVDKTTVTGLAPGNHTVVITQVGTTGTQLCGVSGENANGVILNMHGQAGQQLTANWSQTAAWGGDVASWAGGANYPCNLLVWSLGANDLVAGVTADTFAANARKTLDVVKDNSTTLGAVDILIVAPMIGRQWSTNQFWHDYCSRLRSIAEHFGAAYVGFNPQYRNSWTYAQSQNFFSTGAGNSGAAGSDTVHPGDVGAAAMWAAIKAAVPQIMG